MTLCDPRAGTQHLRRLARAHATGELSTEDYRRRRRAFIEACARARPGWSDDTTVRRVPVASAAPAGEPATAKAGARGGIRPAWLWVLPITVTLLVILWPDRLG
jgi:hypothetical protein